MTEPSSSSIHRSLTVGEIAALTGAEPQITAKLDHIISNVAPIDRAGPADLTFLDNAKYADQLASSRPGACLVAPRLAKLPQLPVNLLLARDPYRAFVTVARKLFADRLRPSSLFAASGTAPGAIVHSSARLEAGVVLDPGVVVGPDAEIGAGTVVAANAVIGPAVRIGRNCSIGAGASILEALIGDRVIVHPGCRIGQDGFGYIMAATGHVKVPQIGRVIIQDDVEIGAGTAIDRGAIRDTVIGEGTKIDNLVQIGHNCSIGRYCIIVSQCGLSGSVTLEDYVVLAGQVGVADHITIGEGAQIGAKSGVMKDVPARGRWLGYPARPGREYLQIFASVRRGPSKGAASGDASGDAAPDPGTDK